MHDFDTFPQLPTPTPSNEYEGAAERLIAERDEYRAALSQLAIAISSLDFATKQARKVLERHK